MARAFVNASNQYLEYNGAVLTAPPVTFAAWYRPASNISCHLVSLSNSGATDWLSLQGGASGQVIAQEYDGTAFPSSTSATGLLSAGVWAHVAGVFASHSSRTVYVNGTPATTNTGTAAVTGLNKTDIGAVYNAAALNTGFMANGDLAEVVAWNVALTDAEVAAHALGISPLLIRPTALIAYWPLLGTTSPEIDLIGRYELTVTGATAAAHPRISLASGPQVFTMKMPAVAGGQGRMFQVF